MSAEKRKFPRADLVFKLKYALEQQQVDIASTTNDVSRGGVSFASDGVYEIGSLMSITFAAEGLEGEITAHARVVRSWRDQTHSHTAVEFTHIDEADLGTIESLIGQRIESDGAEVVPPAVDD